MVTQGCSAQVDSILTRKYQTQALSGTNVLAYFAFSSRALMQNKLERLHLTSFSTPFQCFVIEKQLTNLEKNLPVANALAYFASLSWTLMQNKQERLSLTSFSTPVQCLVIEKQPEAVFLVMCDPSMNEQ